MHMSAPSGVRYVLSEKSRCKITQDDIPIQEKSGNMIEDIKGRKYIMHYAKECTYIMKELVPPRGQADTLQGELLREIEKLRYEAQNNGNQNWDEWFEFFCGHIRDRLCEQPFFTEEEKRDIADITKLFRSCGDYVINVVLNDDLPEDYLLDIDRIAYVEDDLYDYIADRIGQMHAKLGRLVKYEKNPDMYR